MSRGSKTPRLPPIRLTRRRTAIGAVLGAYNPAVKNHPKLKPHVRVEPVAERVAHQVDRERRQKDREPRERRDPPGVQHVHAALAEHVAPRRRRRLHAEPEERQRSEEHTSELQSRLHLVCRLLLEKKKKKKT